MRYSIMIIMLAILVTVTGCKTPEEATNNDHDLFPVIEDVRSIKVLRDDGTNMIIHSTQEGKIEKLLQGLLNDAKPSYIDDPEPFGQIYKVEMMSDSISQTYTVNDLRLTDSLESSVKIYAETNEDHSLAWDLPTSWIQLLLNEQDKANTEPSLYVSTNELSNSVIVLSNRNMMRSSVGKAIEATLTISGLQSDKMPDYSIFWTDPQRFVVRFNNLSAKENVYFRLDDVQAESGESFASESQPIRNQVVLYEKSAFQGLRWVKQQGLIMREQGLDSATLLQPVWTDAQKKNSLIVYDIDDSQRLINLDTGDTKPVQIKQWPEDENSYGNDYGSSVLFSDRSVDGSSYVVKGNHIVYRYSEPDVLQKLYVSDQPIYGIAASPDNSKIAILVPSDSFIGSSADLIVFDEEGNELFREEKASFIGHSDGFLFVYPMTWENDHTIVVPIIGKGDEAFFQGKAYVHAEDGTIEKEANKTLPIDAMNLLKKVVGELDEADNIRVLPKPEDKEDRYFAVQIPITGNWLIDTLENKVTWLGTGILVDWNNSDEVVIWQSAQDVYPFYIGVDLP